VRERRRADGTRSFAVLWRDPEARRRMTHRGSSTDPGRHRLWIYWVA
jgi:hypothetical protein